MTHVKQAGIKSLELALTLLTLLFLSAGLFKAVGYLIGFLEGQPSPDRTHFDAGVEAADFVHTAG